MIFEIKEGLYVDSDEIRGISYRQIPGAGFEAIEKNYVVIVDIKGALGFADQNLTKESAKKLCSEYVKNWREAKELEY